MLWRYFFFFTSCVSQDKNQHVKACFRLLGSSVLLPDKAASGILSLLQRRQERVQTEVTVWVVGFFYFTFKIKYDSFCWLLELFTFGITQFNHWDYRLKKIKQPSIDGLFDFTSCCNYFFLKCYILNSMKLDLRWQLYLTLNCWNYFISDEH